MESAIAGRAQQFGGMFAEFAVLVLRQVQLGPVAIGLLKMETGDLRVLGALLTEAVLEPGGHALVKLGAQALRYRAVGRLLNQHVAEPERGASGTAGAYRIDELL